MATNTRQRCKGINRDGNPCKNYAIEGKEFCHWHLKTAEEQHEILEFLKKHGEAVAAFLIGSLGDAVVGDIYEHLKTNFIESVTPSWGTWSRRLPVKSDDPEWTLLRKSNLLRNAAKLRIGMSRSEVLETIGKPDFQTVMPGPSAMTEMYPPPSRPHNVIMPDKPEDSYFDVVNDDHGLNHRITVYLTYDHYEHKLISIRLWAKQAENMTQT